jgi:hypothetical protein
MKKRSFDDYCVSQGGVVDTAREPVRELRSIGTVRKYLGAFATWTRSWFGRKQTISSKELKVEQVDNKRRFIMPGSWPESPSPRRRQAIRTTRRHTPEASPASSPSPPPRHNPALESPVSRPEEAAPALEIELPKIPRPDLEGRAPTDYDIDLEQRRRQQQQHGKNASRISAKAAIDRREAAVSRGRLSPQTPTTNFEIPRTPGLLRTRVTKLQQKQKNVKRVHFGEENQILRYHKPYPTKIKYYDIGGICGEAPSPFNRMAFQEMRNTQPESSPARSDISTPDKRPLYPDSPAPRTSTTNGRPSSSGSDGSSSDSGSELGSLSQQEEDISQAEVADLAERVDKAQFFQISRVSQAKRDEKKEQARLAEEARVAAERKRIEDEARRVAAERKRVEAAERAKHAIVTDLSPELQKKLQTAMQETNKMKELAPNLTRRDFGTVYPQRGDGIGWLNDEIVNAYLNMVVSKALVDTGYTKAADDVPKYHAFNTNMYDNYKAKGYESVKRWPVRAKIGGKRLLEVEKCFVPVNENKHWTLLTISGTKRTVEYYDSLYNDPDKYAEFGMDFVRNVLGEDFKADEWKVIDASSAQQANGLDCGVFVCMNALALALGKNPVTAFGPHDAQKARRMIAATLINGGLKGELEKQFA